MLRTFKTYLKKLKLMVKKTDTAMYDVYFISLYIILPTTTTATLQSN